MIKFPIECSCQCGGVSYTLFARPQKVIACHCRECQKLSSSPFSVTAMVAAADIEFHGDMKEWARKAASGNMNSGKFCPTCGNRIYQYNPVQPEMVKLKLKPVGLTDDTLFEPTVHVWVSEKLSWYQLPANAVIFDKQGG
jgi:hypothetical protein